MITQVFSTIDKRGEARHTVPQNLGPRSVFLILEILGNVRGCDAGRELTRVKCKNGGGL